MKAWSYLVEPDGRVNGETLALETLDLHGPSHGVEQRP